MLLCPSLNYEISERERPMQSEASRYPTLPYFVIYGTCAAARGRSALIAPPLEPPRVVLLVRTRADGLGRARWR